MNAAVDAAERGDWGARLTALLAAWRETPDAAIADLIERVAERVPAEPVVPHPTAIAGALARARMATDADVSAVLAFVRREVRTQPDLRGVLGVLAGRTRDPRIATALVRLVEEPPVAALRQGGRGALQREIIEALELVDDPRSDSVLVAHAAELGARRHQIRKHRRELDYLTEVVARRMARPLAPPLDLGDAPARIVAALERDHAARRGRQHDADELLAAIFANPADTSLRLVYADVLQERGDPRGEFIALQCARADDEPPSKRERDLLKVHGRTWLGEIEPIVRKQGLAYRRGFLATAREALKYTKDRPALRSLVWSTVEALEVSVWDEHGVAFLADPRWRALRHVYNVQGRETMPALAARGMPLPWTTLGMRYPAPLVWDLLPALLPALEVLDLTGTDAVDHLRAMAGGALHARLRRYRISSDTARTRECLPLVPPGAALEVVQVAEPLGGRESGAIVFLDDHATILLRRTSNRAWLTEQLTSVPPGRLRTIELHAEEKVDVTPWMDLQHIR